MATSTYFNHYNNITEQRLLEDLVIESIKLYGHDVYYLPRTSVSEDLVLGEDVLEKFSTSYFVEMYMANIEGFEGEGDFLSRFGLEIRDEATFIMSPRRFQEVTQGTMNRPLEGDLIYFPMARDLFQIKFVEHEKPMHPLGTLPMWEMLCERYQYSHEKIDTDIGILDEIERLSSYVVDLTLTAGGSGTFTVGESVSQVIGAVATATATVTGGSIASIAVTSAGVDYDDNAAAPTVTITHSGSGTGATATATVSANAITAITVTSGGTGYAGGTVTVTISSPKTTGTVVSWTSGTRILRVNNIGGTKSANNVFKATAGSIANIIGASSSASWAVTSVAAGTFPTDTQASNVEIETDADAILDFTESNPFGSY